MKTIIKSISFVRSEKMKSAEQSSFRINEGTPDAMWLSTGFVRNFYTNKGLDTRTSFQMLLGSTLTWHELEVTEAMLVAGNGKHIVPNPLGGADIVFEKIGFKQYGHSMGRLSDKLEDAIFNSGVVFDGGWAGTATPAVMATTRPAIATAPINGDLPSPTDAPTVDNVVNTLDAEAPGENIPPVQQGTIVTPADEIPA